MRSNELKKQTMTRFFGICLLTFGLVTNAESHLPKNTEEYIDNLNQHYKTNDAGLYNGHSIFLGKLKTLKEKFELNEQKLLMTIILDAYNRIFTRMQNDTQDKSVQQSLTRVMDQLNQLQKHYFSGKHTDLKSYATEVMSLEESDPLVQRKAVFELKKVYKEASRIGDPSAQNRKRRQAKSPQKHRG